MKVYFIVFFLTLVLSIVLPSRTDKEWHWKLFVTFLPLFLFAALRVNFGNDYDNYEMFFNEFHQNSFIFDDTSRSEIGYQFLCYIMPSFRSMLVLNAFMLCLALAVFIDKNVPRAYFWLAIVLIFLNPEKNIYGNLVGMRNGFVVTGFLLGFVLIQKRKLIAFIILTFALSTIHTAALLFLPLAYVVGRNKVFSERELAIWIFVIVALLASSASGLINLATPIVESYFDRYEYYLEMTTGHRGFLLTLSSIVLFALIIILVMDNRKVLTQEQNSLCRLGLVYVCSSFLGSLAIRANYFFDLFFIGTVISLFSMKKKKNSAISWTLIILSFVMSLYSLRLYLTNAYVVGNPLYQVYTSIFGSW